MVKMVRLVIQVRAVRMVLQDTLVPLAFQEKMEHEALLVIPVKREFGEIRVQEEKKVKPVTLEKMERPVKQVLVVTLDLMV